MRVDEVVLRLGALLMTLLLALSMAGCYPMMILKELFKEQEWSDNYAGYPGTECSEPRLIDGDVNTPVGVSRQIIISFPKKFTIYRIILRNINVEDFIVYTSLGENEWKEIAKVKGNRKVTVDLRVYTHTDKLMFRLGETWEDKIIPGRLSRDAIFVHPSIQLGVPKIAEIEIYGFKEKEKREEELIF
ncbi:TPA: hypothetical protein EYP37_13735 [Candidatus Poribacteria bacterium]|nr:hypothetical protein [Candidatus Poribacteria bacterium]